MTKNYYRKIVDDALNLAKNELSAFPDSVLNQSVYKQLIDIKRTVIEEGRVYTEEEAIEKYPFAVMAARNYDGYEDWDYPKMLSDISWGISRYPSMTGE